MEYPNDTYPAKDECLPNIPAPTTSVPLTRPPPRRFFRATTPDISTGDPLDGEKAANRGTRLGIYDELTTNSAPVAPVDYGWRDEALKSMNVKVGIMFASKACVQLITNTFVGPLTNKYALILFHLYTCVHIYAVAAACGERGNIPTKPKNCRRKMMLFSRAA